ncbi:Putative glycosyltransferase EpsE [Psychrobacter sp. SC65A.3]|uniref:glycosyltransferase family 2 protein n=1 Tax=Psychrobacter sp. SC65A.3 TaxID=2983299 RepID=UPI0021D96997|nr:glycosyltransferase [Psychrobacter sp. SC65A.3]WAI88444.1 Putative glycosyltransferase EpsE [Psychrobacter sp. SC65A.3]
MNISIAVITYNSSDTIIETLNSILNQDYGVQNIELIISDDASKDNTVRIIEEWLDVNEESFFKVDFIKNLVNMGVTENCNTVWKSSNSEWIKTIAGDDILETYCINANIKYINTHPECKVLFSKMRWFGNIDKVTPSPHDINFFKKDSAEQNNLLKVFSFNIAPTSFINRNALIDVGYADKRYKTIEDLPLWLKFTDSGYKLYFLNSITVNYRTSESISMSEYRYANIDLINNLIAINKNHVISFINHPIIQLLRIEQLLSLYLTVLISFIFKNKKTKTAILLGRVMWIFRPIHFIRKVAVEIYNSIYLYWKKS